MELSKEEDEIRRNYSPAKKLVYLLRFIKQSERSIESLKSAQKTVRDFHFEFSEQTREFIEKIISCMRILNLPKVFLIFEPQKIIPLCVSKKL